MQGLSHRLMHAWVFDAPAPCVVDCTTQLPTMPLGIFLDTLRQQRKGASRTRRSGTGSISALGAEAQAAVAEAETMTSLAFVEPYLVPEQLRSSREVGKQDMGIDGAQPTAAGDASAVKPEPGMDVAATAAATTTAAATGDAAPVQTVDGSHDSAAAASAPAPAPVAKPEAPGAPARQEEPSSRAQEGDQLIEWLRSASEEARVAALHASNLVAADEGVLRCVSCRPPSPRILFPLSSHDVSPGQRADDVDPG